MEFGTIAVLVFSLFLDPNSAVAPKCGTAQDSEDQQSRDKTNIEDYTKLKGTVSRDGVSTEAIDV
jgi:hypothetical protein